MPKCPWQLVTVNYYSVYSHKSFGLKSAVILQSNRETTQRHSPTCSPKEYVVNLLANERSQAEKFAVDPMQNGLETVSLTWIFAVK